MPAGKRLPQASLPVIEEPFLARNLFSYHFLKERLPREDPRWRRDEERNLDTFDRVKKLYRRVRPAEKEQYQRNEANLEKDFIRPILDLSATATTSRSPSTLPIEGPRGPITRFFLRRRSGELLKETPGNT